MGAERRAEIRASLTTRARRHGCARGPAGPRAARAASLEWLGRRPLCERAPSGPVDRAELDALLASRRGDAPLPEPTSLVLLPGEAIEMHAPVQPMARPAALLALLLLVAVLAASYLRAHHEAGEAQSAQEGVS